MAARKLELTEEQQAKFQGYDENVHYKMWGIKRVKCTFYKCEECSKEVGVKLSDIKRRIKVDNPLICNKCRVKSLHILSPKFSSDEYSKIISSRGLSKKNTTGYLGSSLHTAKGYTNVRVQVMCKLVRKCFHIPYNSDDDLKCGAWLRDDYIRSMGYPHALNFSDEEHEALRTKYQGHPKKDWVSKIKDKE